MPLPLQDALQAALATTYVIERELVRGGMAQVFLATDRALGRQVVIKVLAPEIAHSVSADRFHREIHLAAKLQHPHIVPLLSAGQAGELLYYTMPFVAGESLKARLDRRHEVPIPDAVRLLTQVARALTYAHNHGVVHRDIKPANILLSQGEAQVTDFGIAKALSESADADALTTCGLVLGTPAYMAPEQALNEGVDQRADLYSLGVVAYEMLTGTLPFSGRTLQAILAAQVQVRPAELALCRPDVPARIANLVMRLLEKDPSARPQRADEVVRVLESASASESRTATTRSRSFPAVNRSWLAAGLFAGIGLVAGVIALPKKSQAPSVDRAVLAITPFKVTAADSSVRYLREGMLDLLVAKLSGTPNLRAVDPRTMLRAWQAAGGSDGVELDRPAALTLARKLGAGQLLEGQVIGSPRHLVLTAGMITTQGGTEIRASVEGPADSLTALVDRLAAQLLALTSGEERHRLAALTTTSLPALRAWLNGRAAHRRGDYATATDFFDQAIEHDSTFALAALSRDGSAIWLDESTADPGRFLAWRHRDRLSGRDLTLLRFLLGSRYPIPGDVRDDLANGEALVAAAPDNPQAWATLGDQMLHYGALTGVADATERAIRLYERALSLDSSYAPSREHLSQLYYAAGDTVLARRMSEFQLRVAPDASPLERWFARTFLNDSAPGAAPFAPNGLLPGLETVVTWALQYGGGVADAESLLSLRLARSASEAESKQVRGLAWTYYVIRGQPTKAVDWLRNPQNPEHRAEIILGAVYADSDSSQAARLVRRTPIADLWVTAQSTWQGVVHQYAAAQYDLSNGRRTPARNAVRAWSLVWAPDDSSQVRRLASYLALLLDAQVAALDHRPDALSRLQQLDSVLQTGPTFGGYLVSERSFGGFEPIGNLVAGRLWHERGETRRALAAVRRRALILPTAVFITQLREEARYAALLGDTRGAIRAGHHYLALRSDAEPRLQTQVRAVRAELAALESATEVD